MTNEFPRGLLNPTILSTLSHGDRYGYEIIEEIKEKTGIEIKQPSLYSSLKRMEVQKLVSSYWKDSSIGGKRHYYCLTNDGRKFLEENPVDFSIYNVPKKEEVVELESSQTDLQSGIDSNFKTPNENGIVLNSCRPVPLFPEKEEKEGIVEPIKVAMQENIFNLQSQNTETEVKNDKVVDPPKQEQQSEQFDLFNEVDMANDDGVFITETIEDYSFPKFEKFEPATLNIEQRNSSYLSTKLKDKETTKQNQPYQEKISDMMAKPFDHEKSMAKIQQKIDQFEAEKKRQKEAEERKFAPPSPVQKNKEQAIREEFTQIDNVYIREKDDSKIFNSYQSLQTYFLGKGIGFSQYRIKDSSSSKYVNPALIRLVRGCLFLVLSIALSIAFYLGIKSDSIGKIIYVIIPSCATALVCAYFISYRKTRVRNIIQMKKEEDVSPLILPIVGVSLILVIIGVNLILGFRASNTMKYFPLLIYPIVLSIHVLLITPINKMLQKLICFFKKRFSKR